MGDTGGRDYKLAGRSLLLNVSDGESTTPFQNKIELVRSLVGMDTLRLLRLEAIQTNRDVLALPQCGFVKLLRL